MFVCMDVLLLLFSSDNNGCMYGYVVVVFSSDNYGCMYGSVVVVFE